MARAAYMLTVLTPLLSHSSRLTHRLHAARGERSEEALVRGPTLVEPQRAKLAAKTARPEVRKSFDNRRLLSTRALRSAQFA